MGAGRVRWVRADRIAVGTQPGISATGEGRFEQRMMLVL